MAFALVFRTNVANTRYWEARTHAGTMSSKWADSAAMVLSFEEMAIKQERAKAHAEFDACEAARLKAEEEEGRGQGQEEGEGRSCQSEAVMRARKASDAAAARVTKAFERSERSAQAELLHLFSLMHALALGYLRRDNELSNLCEASEIETDGTIYLGDSAEAHKNQGNPMDDSRPGRMRCLRRMWQGVYAGGR